MHYGFIKTGACVPEMKVADTGFNLGKIKECIEICEQKKIGITVFPELCITGYTCADLFHQDLLIKNALDALIDLKKFTQVQKGIYIIGLPMCFDGAMYNCAAVLHKGKITGIVPKTYIPNYGEFYEKRWFLSSQSLKSRVYAVDGEDVPVGSRLLFQNSGFPGLVFAVEIGEDLNRLIPPSSAHIMAGANVIFCPAADSEGVGKKVRRMDAVVRQSDKGLCGYVWASSGANESGTDMVYGGHALLAECGHMLAESERFAFSSQMIESEIDIEKIRHTRLASGFFGEDITETIRDYRYVSIECEDYGQVALTRHINPHPFVPFDQAELEERCCEIIQIQSTALAKRMKHTGIQKPVIGVSGGLDSTLALLAVVAAMDKLGLPRKNIITVTMPGFGTTDRTYANAIALIKALGTDYREIDITKACLLHFEDIGHDPNVHDTTYENVQARERYQILMDMANREGGLVVGTGDLSEIALGWCTYNGDHMSMYAINAGVPKTMVRHVVRWMGANSSYGIEKIVADILDTPISPELLPKKADGSIEQKTEDIVGPYELHDFFLYEMIRFGSKPEKILYLAKHAFREIYDEETIRKWLALFLRRFFSQQFKRSCSPDGPKIGSVSLSPRSNWKMPSDAVAAQWLKALDG